MVELVEVGQDIIYVILSFFGPKELCRFGLLSKDFNRRYDSILEKGWFQQTVFRWKLSPATQKKFSKFRSSKEVYEFLLERQQIPYGKYTNNPLVFGQNHSSDLSVWIMLAHSNNGLLKESASSTIADLRICLQNLSPYQIPLDVERRNFLSVHTLPSNETKDGTLSCRNIRLLSKNHDLLTGLEKTVTLNTYDIAVLSAKVACPDSIHNEPEFLSILTEIEVRVSNNLTVKSGFIPEAAIWDSYEALPRGIFILKSATSADR
jgi:hypothetical protein